MSLTIGQTIDELHGSLRDYIEATYHISNPGLIGQRQQLLDQPGVIHQRPYLESTPRYRSGPRFSEIGLPDQVLALLQQLSDARHPSGQILFDPPWEHQATALQSAFVDGQSLLVATGTGSGKTECFVLPILAKLANEASTNGGIFGDQAAIRALVLYPMNALVNDQLGRLRLLFGDERVVGQFMDWSGRAARFARYTSRTLYPGVRTRGKDSKRLSVIDHFYIDYLRRANEEPSEGQEQAAALVGVLRDKGKWPAKDDLQAWFGRKGSRWLNRDGEFQRCITMPRDAELFTRHEIHAAPPDILITNYSMLEYMLMRPLERPVFEQTSSWLTDNPDKSFLLVIDEAHLYRGAAGAEVALLVRRLRSRLNIPPERLQVICTSASFDDPDYAVEFAAQLTGKRTRDFADPILGTLQLRDETIGDAEDADVLARIDLGNFYSATTDEERASAVSGFLENRGVTEIEESLERSVHDALLTYGPIGHLINRTMEQALPVDEISSLIFPNVPPQIADRAVTNLIALGSFAHRSPNEPGLLPCRVHSFYRGLAGLWACMDSNCSALDEDSRIGVTGKLYAQPRDTCSCGARVLELFTCRHCGSAYARAYTDQLDEPRYLWAEPGGAFRTLIGMLDELKPLDLLIEGEPIVGEGEAHLYDVVTGQLDPVGEAPRSRTVFLPRNRHQPDEVNGEMPNAGPGQFRPCAICGQQAAYGRSSVQDHQTKGDQPFQALVSKQIQVQSPGTDAATPFAPLRGRKVLVFSDSRQTAARLAPNVQKYSMQDVMRPLLMRGYSYLMESERIGPDLNLLDAYFAVLLSAAEMGIRLRPALAEGETFAEALEVREAIDRGALTDERELLAVHRRVSQTDPPESILTAIISCITDQYFGLESLGLASIAETDIQRRVVETLPDIPTIAESLEQKSALLRLWLTVWVQKQGFWLRGMPDAWNDDRVRSHSGNFLVVQRFLDTTVARRIFKNDWLPSLLRVFGEQRRRNKYRLRGGELTLDLTGSWGYCDTCRKTQRPFPHLLKCTNCGQQTVRVIDPNVDPIFQARKGFYRSSTIDALSEERISPMALIAAEHTAQLNAAQSDAVFSVAEEHELLFQDIDLGPDETGADRAAIDILSCTTTFEVGIDIGALSGVALRNMPPARANYQQRAGRAGRRGKSVATVIAFGSADSHDEHYFSTPELMIRGRVDDPRLTLDNLHIIRRHVTAYLLQRYHRTRLPDIEPEDQPQLFEVLGSVHDFLDRNSILNRWDFMDWIQQAENELREDISSWLPLELDDDVRLHLLENLVPKTERVLNIALGTDEAEETQQQDVMDTGLEVPAEEGEERPPTNPGSGNLLDRLLYKGVLPRYAFPTDVATFHVFVPDSNEFRPEFRYAPSQGLSVALTQYAPGKEVWIDNKLWRSGAIYSTMQGDRYGAWQNRRLYFECRQCHHSATVSLENAERGEVRDCDACGAEQQFGPARIWLRPPGFAHRVSVAEGTTPDDQPPRSYATRAKLMAPTPPDNDSWAAFNERVRAYHLRDYLLVTNRGPRDEGYNYCTSCGVIDPCAMRNADVLGAHRKPYPTNRDSTCSGDRVSRGIVLGTDFLSDVLLISIDVDNPVRLRPGDLVTDVALRTVSEALATAACRRLGLEPLELQSEYRPAVSPAGQEGRAAEVFLYDTLPGGAGFSKRAGELGTELLQLAWTILENCPDNCDRSCYRCLRSYKNKFEHDLLDRHVGASLLQHLLDGSLPSLSNERREQGAELLYEDLERQARSDIEIERNVELSAPGLPVARAPILISRSDGPQFVIGINNSLTPGHFADEALGEWAELSTTYSFIPVDDLIVRRNLPYATQQVATRVGLA